MNFNLKDIKEKWIRDNQETKTNSVNLNPERKHLYCGELYTKDELDFIQNCEGLPMAAKMAIKITREEEKLSPEQKEVHDKYWRDLYGAFVNVGLIEEE